MNRSPESSTRVRATSAQIRRPSTIAPAAAPGLLGKRDEQALSLAHALQGASRACFRTGAQSFGVATSVYQFLRM